MTNLLVSIWTLSCCFIILCAINIRIVAESSISLPHRTSSSLVLEMPVEASERPVLSTLVLQEKWTLLGPKFLQISAIRKEQLSMSDE